MSRETVHKDGLNVAQIFQTYLTFGGDVDRTAAATGVSRADVRALAIDEKWADRVAELNELRDGDPRDVQIQINRAVNYVQAHRLRSIVDTMIAHISKLQPEELAGLFTKTTKDGAEFTARPLTDLVKAAEACQQMSARALGDTVAERPEDPGRAGSSIALQVMKAMNAADASGLSSVELVRKQLTAPPSDIQPPNP